MFAKIKTWTLARAVANVRKFFPISHPNSYTPTFFLRHHLLQSIYELASPQINIPFKREKVYFMDGGHISLDWLGK